MMFLPFALVLVFIHTVKGQSNLFDVSENAFRITCDPTPGNCVNNNGSPDYEYSSSQGITGKPFIAGELFQLETSSSAFVSGGAK